MPKLTVKQKGWLLSAHIGFAALWTGTVLSMFLLALSNRQSESGAVLYAVHKAVNLLDDVVVIPAAMGSVLTATALCWLTNYGFTKFWWVISKWIMTVSLVIFGTFWLYPWSVNAEALAQSQGMAAFEASIYRFDVQGVLLGSAAQVVCLLIIIVISAVKPWGRRSVKSPEA